ncbi:hypothetical protein DNTS_026575 [Danionella cerebrum]|uniref:Uncharacterized protein n=1 Tax=Danionella cerebrum TaxID=2873325 RepID=A0A553RK29_9TELE|nr:hypothetical protein DNTS_026575 [Danionella translucida]
MRTCSRCFALFSPALLFLFACPRLSRTSGTSGLTTKKNDMMMSIMTLSLV